MNIPCSGFQVASICAVILCCIHFINPVNAQNQELSYKESDIDAHPRADFIRQIVYNETIEFYAFHEAFIWYPWDDFIDFLKLDFLNSKSHLGLRMRDSFNNYVVYVFIEPTAKSIYLQCVVEGDLEQGPPAIAGTGEYSRKKEYNILLIFTTTGIKLFLGKEYQGEVKECVRRIPEIVGFDIKRSGVFDVTLKVTMSDTSVIVPGDWHISKHIPMDHRIIIHYFPDNRQNQSIVTIRLTDKNEIVALTVTIDYQRAFLLTKRERFDDDDVECVNFGSSLIHLRHLLGRIEIEIHPMFYKVRIETDVSGETKECTVDGHYMYPYDIYRAIFDSTEKESIPYRYYIEQL